MTMLENDVPIDFSKNATARMNIPPAYPLIGVTILYGFLISSTAVALYNLVPPWSSGWIPSLLWLGLLSLTTFAFIQDEGLRQLGNITLSLFSRRHFVDAVTTTKGKYLAFACHFCGKPILLRSIALTNLSGLSWNPGQATARAGQDLDDWSLALWYRNPQGSKYKAVPGLEVPKESLHIVGPCGPQAEVEKRGHELLGFLGTLGVLMEAAEGHMQYVVPSNSVTPDNSSGNGTQGSNNDQAREPSR